MTNLEKTKEKKRKNKRKSQTNKQTNKKETKEKETKEKKTEKKVNSKEIKRSVWKKERSFVPIGPLLIGCCREKGLQWIDRVYDLTCYPFMVTLDSRKKGCKVEQNL